MLDKKVSKYMKNLDTRLGYTVPNETVFRLLSDSNFNFKNKKILDIGIGNGDNLLEFQRRGGGGGIEGPKSSMWKHMARIIGEVRPQYVFVENSPILTTRGLGVVLADLSKMGFDAKWGVVSAADVGANHLRERIWIRAVCNANNTGLQRNEWVRFSGKTRNKSQSSRLSWWSTEPDVLRVANGIPARVDRLKAIGNGQVPLCAATAWELLK